MRWHLRWKCLHSRLAGCISRARRKSQPPPSSLLIENASDRPQELRIGLCRRRQCGINPSMTTSAFVDINPTQPDESGFRWFDRKGYKTYEILSASFLGGYLPRPNRWSGLGVGWVNAIGLPRRFTRASTGERNQISFDQAGVRWLAAHCQVCYTC